MANVKIGALDAQTVVYHTRIKEFNHGMVRHYQGKWYATRALAEGRQSTLWAKAEAHRV